MFLYIYICICCETNRSDTNAGIIGDENHGKTNDTSNYYIYFYIYFHRIYGHRHAARIWIWHAGSAWMGVCSCIGGVFLYVIAILV